MGEGGKGKYYVENALEYDGHWIKDKRNLAMFYYIGLTLKFWELTFKAFAWNAKNSPLEPFLNKKNTDIYFRNFFKIKEIKKKSLNLFIDPSALNNFLNYENVIPFKNLNFLDEIKTMQLILKRQITAAVEMELED